jgi:hypothetical protein
MSARSIAVSVTRIQSLIYMIRAEKVMLDTDLATLYGVTTFALNQAVKRNRTRFPADFCFQLTPKEWAELRSATPASESVDPQDTASNSSRFVMSSSRNRGAAYRPYAFTEQGVAMLSGVLRSSRAVQVNIEIMRTFVQLRAMLISNVELARKLAGLEQKYDEQFKVVFDAIRELMSPEEPQPAKPQREIGFHTIPQNARRRKK